METKTTPVIHEEQARQKVSTFTPIGTPQQTDEQQQEDDEEGQQQQQQPLQQQKQQQQNEHNNSDETEKKKEGEECAKPIIQDEWRTVPGYVLEVLNKVPIPQFVHSRFAQFQVLLGRFLFNSNPSPLTDLPLFEGSSFGKKNNR